MKKQKTTKATLRPEPIMADIDVEMLYAAAEAHPSWEIIPGGMGIRRFGREGPNTPQKLLEWFLKKGRH
jgi:hypothetical protein